MVLEVCYEWHDVSVGGETGSPCNFRVFVLMNGKVVQPVKVVGEPWNQEVEKGEENKVSRTVNDALEKIMKSGVFN